jgi:hypothetical protein
MVEEVGCGFSEPMPLLVGKHAFYRIYRLFTIWEFHFNKEKNIAECIILAVAHVDVKIVQLDGVVRFEFEVNRFKCTPALQVYGLVSFEFAGRIA